MSVDCGVSDLNADAVFGPFVTHLGSGVCIAVTENHCLIGYSITPSALTSSVFGTVRPSAITSFGNLPDGTIVA